MEISTKIKYLHIFALLLFALSFQLFADSTYVVKKGDTLYSISRKYEITVPELRTANNLSENDVLKVGVKLVIPSADIGNAAALSSDYNKDAKPKVTNNNPTSFYTVSKGDTLYGIARKYGLKLPELLSMNNLDNSSTIKIGQKIRVPAKNQAPVVKPIADTSVKIVDSTKSKDNTPGVKTSGIVWPLTSPLVKKISGKVSGVLLTGDTNEKVKCVREGTVMYTGVYRGFGEVVFVQSKTGLIYSYTGLSSVTANKGDYVLAGSELGKIGSGSDSTMKFMVFQNGMPMDPAKAPRG